MLDKPIYGKYNLLGKLKKKEPDRWIPSYMNSMKC